MRGLLVFRLTALLLGLSAVGYGQALSFDVRPPPPAQLKSSHLWNITLQNPTRDTSSGYLHVEASDVSTGTVFTANTQELLLPPGARTLSARDIRLTDIWCDTGYGAFAAPDSLLPEGDYAYNLTLMPEMTLRTLSLQVHAPGPLKLVWPVNGAEVTDSLPLFVWRPPVIPGFYSEYLYSVRVGEVKSGQSCSLAISSGVTIVEHCRSSQTAWRYTSGTTRLEPGKTYAWRVEA
jgi:hypothetical protein